jgi:PleD family two-component response regulator
MASSLDLFAASDEALFRSKQSGRNRVSLGPQA